ncbi:hypothetical protein RCH22_002149 [Cryobacterium psychrotolerans]|nr:hypothetical protein [Cryobacterium psychrotolerans]
MSTSLETSISQTRNPAPAKSRCESDEAAASPMPR